MRTAALLVVFAACAAPLPAGQFDATGWTGHRSFKVSETAGLDRENEPVEVPWLLRHDSPAANAALRLVGDSGAELTEVPAQFFQIEAGPGSTLGGRVVFLCTLAANKSKSFRLYFGPASFGPARYPTKLSIRPAEKGPIDGPMHWMIENDFYRIETYPKNAQIWHIWNKQGANRIWWFKEWNGLEKGGDPVHWSPNTWVAYPDRRKNGAPAAFDWHYAVGWVTPQIEIIEGPLFHQIRRWGPVLPHPEHTDARFERPASPIVWAEVTYRFYADLPWYWQASTLKTLEDIPVYFIRNNQMVFNYSLFSHLALQPATPGLLPGDVDETSVLPLTSHHNRAPFKTDHTLSNVVPSKLSFYSLFNPKTHDAYANLPLLERNSGPNGGAATMFNHAMCLTERHDWAVYFARIFNYTNQRFNPENITFLPKGQQFEEENVHLIYRYDRQQSLEQVGSLRQRLNYPLRVEWVE